MNGANKNLVIFKVQVGAFKNEPPSEKQAQFAKVKGITKEVTAAGLNRYVAGGFNDYKSAEAYKAELVKNGITDAFVIAFFNGEYITIQEAIELAK
jgi:cell division protein FtsN